MIKSVLFDKFASLPEIDSFCFFVFFTVRLIGTVNCLQLIFTRREIVLRCTTAGKFIHEIVIKGVSRFKL